MQDEKWKMYYNLIPLKNIFTYCVIISQTYKALGTRV